MSAGYASTPPEIASKQPPCGFPSESAISPPRFDVLATSISIVNPALFCDTVDAFFAMKERQPGAYVVFRDVHGVVRAIDEPRLQEAHRKALIVAPDGLPLAWLGHIRGHRGIQRVCGPDTLPLMCAHGLTKGRRHVFVGGTPETLAALAKNLEARFPGLIIAALISPPFRALSEDETLDLVRRINDAKPDFIWVGLGSPKQDLWMLDHARQFPGALCMGVGAAFDMHAGHVKRCPDWLQSLGLEWSYRAAQEPGRLLKRYLSVVPRFLWLLTTESLRRRGATVEIGR